MGWSRWMLKSNAKEVLSKCYWKAFIAALLIAVYPFSAWGGMNSHLRGIRLDMNNFQYQIPHNLPSLDAARLSLLAGAAMALVMGSILVGFFVIQPLGVGARRFFLEATQQRYNLAEVGFGFFGGGYLNVVWTLFLRDIYLIFWTFLFFFPGIVKLYSYSLTEYILAENPSMTASRAITISRRMMRGNKWRAFVLDCSFIGWYILGAMALGVGTLFVNPYYQATRTQLYLVLRAQALQAGDIILEELVS